MGEFEGQTAPPDWKEVRWKLDTFKASGGERLDEILERARCFVSKILDQFHGKTILFTAHNGIIQAIITAIFEESWEHMKTIERQGNTGITIFEFNENKKPFLKLMSCTKHLE
ncbi:hypothetical protein BMS3Abin17_00565 [archaeon BMS3Abin17]|nr:hypothetical protein BMS3Abin17_00565 [archaeon BMS3Abin17]HDZ60625.1 hypothetical protein [Candidatus Pacearchaeota archaeon]